MSKVELGNEQIRVMRVLWEKRRATAQEITDALSTNEPVKLVNIQMLLRRLVQKKIVDYDVVERTYVYFPLVEKDNVTHQALHNFIDHIFAGSTDEMISYVLKNERISPEVLERIGIMLDKKDNRE